MAGKIARRNRPPVIGIDCRRGAPPLACANIQSHTYVHAAVRRLSAGCGGGGVSVKYPIVERETIRVAYTTSVGDPATSDAFARLEQIVPLKGNRFFATFDITTKEYRACMALKAGET